ncbi:sclt1 domain protein [Vibrio sp. HENC-03]|nr:sclt1 domain protein [Vibrio sp. HENC-03]
MALEIEEYKNKLGELTANKQINYYQKLELYKSVSAPLIDLVANITHQEMLTRDYIRGFDKQRLHMTAQLALFASSDVFDMFMDLIDYMYSSIESDTFEFHVYRVDMLKFLSEVRKDIGIYTDEITYKGSR